MIAPEHLDTITDGVGSRLLPILDGELTITAAAHGWTGHLLGHRLGLPTAADGSVPGSLRIDARPDGETWTREFDGHRWHSVLAAADGDTIRERIGLLTLRFSIDLDAHWDTQISLRSIAIGPVRLPILSWFDIHGTIAPDGTTHVEMSIPGGSCTYVARFDRATSMTSAVRR